ncbi:MAG TPA: ATP-dependent helicase C-terminal domain-containing protein, partial [Myxococcales bacterium]|nr:ATP-dependent helicase C-terminal domain-containing protein [Myxococcales bacterium]
PPPRALESARALLRRIGALDGSGQATAIGRACAKLPIHPRIARLVIEAAQRGHRGEGCTAAAMLNERELRRTGDPAPTGPSDVLDLLDHRPSPRVEQARAQLLRLAPPDGNGRGSRDEALLISVLTGFLDRVAKRRGEEILLASGGAARLAPESAVRDAPLMVAVDAEERRVRGRSGVVVRIASAIEPEWLLDLQAEALREETELVWVPERERVEVAVRLLYDRLVLEESRRLVGAGEAAAAGRLLLDHAAAIPDPAELSRLRARVELIAKHCPEAGIGPLSDANVRAVLEEAARHVSSLRELRETDLLGPLTPPQLARLAPDHVVLPGGRKVRIEYTEGQPPAIRSRLQDFFGLARGPSICDGRVPLTLHLLAPSGRAQQVTQDLSGFWERHYPAIRRELMRKYPKHSWPEDGATAVPSVNRRP